MTLVSAIEVSVAFARAFNEKRPKPAPFGRSCPAQRSVSRSDAESTVRLPSSAMFSRLTTVPSKASLTGALDKRARKPERSPESAEAKLATLMLPSIRSPRQVNSPVAAKEREIDGQASDTSMPLAVSRHAPDIVVIGQRAISDADFRERNRCGSGPQLPLEPLDQRLPVRQAVGAAPDDDARIRQDDVGDLEPLQHQRQHPQVRGQLIDGQRGIVLGRRA